MKNLPHPLRLFRGRQAKQLLLAILLVGGVFESVTLLGNELPASQESPKVPAIVAQVDLVNLEVSVTNEQGDFVAGLTRENFRVLDNGREQPITHFAPTEAPVQVLMLVETSPAVYLIHRQHLLAAEALLRSLGDGDQVALATYDRSIRLERSFTADKQVLASALDGLGYSLGSAELNLFDALSNAQDWLVEMPGRQAIVLLSTGLDTSEGARWRELARKLGEGRAVVFPIALGGELRERPDRKSKKRRNPETPDQDSALSFEEADRNLVRIAELTGGKAYFPRSASEFTSIYQQIGRRLRNQYTLGFTPPARDGQIHRIEVQIAGEVPACVSPKKTAKAGSGSKAAAGCRVWSRREYVAPGPN